MKNKRDNNNALAVHNNKEKNNVNVVEKILHTKTTVNLKVVDNLAPVDRGKNRPKRQRRTTTQEQTPK